MLKMRVLVGVLYLQINSNPMFQSRLTLVQSSEIVLRWGIESNTKILRLAQFNIRVDNNFSGINFSYSGKEKGYIPNTSQVCSESFHPGSE
jgi:hypothetical protein